MGLATPAQAAVVSVTGTMVSPTGEALDGTVTAYQKYVDTTTTPPTVSWDSYDYVSIRSGKFTMSVSTGYEYKFKFTTSRGYYEEFYNDKKTLETADAVNVTAAVNLNPVVLESWPTVTGTVTSAAGTPVASGTVTAYSRPTGPTTTTWPIANYANIVDGAYSLPLQPGIDYKFKFEGRGPDNGATFVPEWYNDKATQDAAEIVKVAGPTSLAPVALATNPIVTGKVVDANGAALAGITVRVYPTADDTGKAYTTQPSQIASGVTDEFGAFRIFTPTGAVKLEVGNADKWVGEWFNDKADYATADVVNVGTGADVGVISLGSGGTVTGTVTSDAGAPLERVWVSVGSRSDYTNAAGVFVIENVPVGSYQLTYEDPLREYLAETYSDKKLCPQATYTCTPAESAAVFDPVKMTPGAVVTANATLTPNPKSAVDPTKVDLSGKVTDTALKNVVGGTVEAWTTPADGSKPQLAESTRVRRDGSYAFTNLGAGADPSQNKSLPAEDTYRVFAYDSMSAEKEDYSRYQGRYFGDTTVYAKAKDVVAGATGTGINITLPLSGGITGLITSESGLSVANTQVYLQGTNGLDSAQAKPEKADGVYKNMHVIPGDYKVYFSDGNAVSMSGVGATQGIEWHAPEWYDNTTFDKAKIVTIKSGALTSGINAALNKAMVAYEAPEIAGGAYVGKTVSVGSNGVWNVTDSALFTYEWLVNGAVVGTGETLALTSAHVGKTLTLRVNVAWHDASGSATSLPVKVGYQPKVKMTKEGSWMVFSVKAKPVKVKQINGTVKVREIVRLDAEGMPVYKTIGKGKIKQGMGAASLKKIIKKVGKHKLEYTFTFKSKVGGAVMTKNVKIKGASLEKVTPKPVFKTSSKKGKKKKG